MRSTPPRGRRAPRRQECVSGSRSGGRCFRVRACREGTSVPCRRSSRDRCCNPCGLLLAPDPVPLWGASSEGEPSLEGCTHGQPMSLLHRHAVFTSEILGLLPGYSSGRVLASISISALLSLMWLFYCTGSFTM